MRVYVGCGANPIPGWVNLDNSLTVKLARYPLLPDLLLKVGLMSPVRKPFIERVRRDGILRADATKRIPLFERWHKGVGILAELFTPLS